jgi:hypothetical protein
MIYSSSSRSAASAPSTPRTLLPTSVIGSSSQPCATTNGNGGYNAVLQQQPQQQPIHVLKTSHKAAEQKRRDSLKTTFDDLRKLLPPILLANDSSSPSLGPSTPASPIFLATTPLLPGSLPPRGPPKAGGEGPNKGVSKLQLLICGNEFIRVLKARVERRDEEIERLRKEVGRLRGLVGGGGGGEEEVEKAVVGKSTRMSMDMSSTRMMGRIDEDSEGDEGGENGEGDELDLERDLDAIELEPSSNGGGGAHLKNSGSGGRDHMDEGDDEED